MLYRRPADRPWTQIGPPALVERNQTVSLIFTAAG